MTVQNPAFVMAGMSHSAELFRRATFAGVGVGVAGPDDLEVTPSGAMGVDVALGGVVIPGTITASQGAYYGYNDAPVTLAIATADPAFPRVDLVVATAEDAAYAGGTTAWLLQIITGTAASSPVPPALPASSLLIASVAVPAAVLAIASGDITDGRVFVGVAGGGGGGGGGGGLIAVPEGRLYGAAGQSIPSDTWTEVVFASSTYANNGMVIVGNGLQFPVSGLYSTVGQLHWAAFTAAAENVTIALRDSLNPTLNACVGTSTSADLVQGVGSVVAEQNRRTAGSVITLWAYQDSGADQVLNEPLFGAGDEVNFLASSQNGL